MFSFCFTLSFKQPVVGEETLLWINRTMTNWDGLYEGITEPKSHPYRFYSCMVGLGSKVKPSDIFRAKGWWTAFITTMAFSANKLPWQPAERPSALLSCQPWILMKTYYWWCFIQCVYICVCSTDKPTSQAGTIHFSACWRVTSGREVFLFLFYIFNDHGLDWISSRCWRTIRLLARHASLKAVKITLSTQWNRPK